MPNFKLVDRFNFFLACVGFGDNYEKALHKAQLSLPEAIIAHDNFLPETKKVKEIVIDGKKYRYVGNGHFRRIDKLGRYYVETNKIGVKKLGFVKNPLEFIFKKG